VLVEERWEADLRPMSEGAYFFGDYRFFPRRQLLLRGEVPVRIGARALDLLQMLLERQGELVSKAELIKFAWPDTYVHESNLKVNIAALRRSLPQERAEFPYIVTVPGRGYRFAALARFETADALSMPPSAGGGAFGSSPQGPHILVGRDDDVAELAKTVCERGFVTIVGPAGVGKTTVAIAAARELAGRFPDGVCFVDLAAINDPQLVCPAIASSLGSGAGFVDLLVGIVEALRTRDVLLILDNCEHVLATAALVADHIHLALPQVGIIATSREPFRTRTENVYRLAPLRCPDGDVRVDRRQAMSYSAVELFVTRAQELAGYTLSDLDASVVADICRRLDGIPLAIELAAPRLKTCDPATLIRHLNESFDLLNYGPRTAPLRHQALQATLDWSYRLLSEAEAMLLRHLSMFAGMFALEDVLGVTSETGTSPGEIAACLENLASKSLVSQIHTDSRSAYRLLDTTRSYAGERLRAAGEDRSAYEGYASYLCGLFEQAEAEWKWLAREEWIATYGRRANDLRRAIDWAFGEDGDIETGLRLSVAAIPLWDELSSVAECRQRVRTALDVAKRIAHPDLQLQMKLATAYARSLSFTEQLEPEAEAACLESVRLAELIGDADYRLRSVWGLAVLQSFAGRHRDVLASLDRFDAISAQTNDASAASAGARFRIMTRFYRGDITGAHDDLKQLATRHDTLAQRSRISRFQVDPYVVVRVSLAFVGWVCGDTIQAVRHARAAVNGATATEHLVSQSNALALASIPIALWTGDVDAAEHQVHLLLDNLNRRNLASWGPLSRFFGAAARHQRGKPDAVEQMRTAANEILASKFLIRAPLYLSMLAEAALDRGRVQLARSSISAALALAERLDETWCRPELLRILGRIEHQHGDRTRAEQALVLAVQSAGQSGALSLQLRAATDLAEIWTEAGAPSVAAAVLHPICQQFAADSVERDVARARRVLDRARGRAASDLT
jgi:predicted ATPase/DNA-binding winged helix-turn-helix (wHTH) protein